MATRKILRIFWENGHLEYCQRKNHSAGLILLQLFLLRGVISAITSQGLDLVILSLTHRSSVKMTSMNTSSDVR